jgi:phage gp45-like
MNYRTEFTQYTQNTSIIGNCNAITFINTGTINVQVNQFLLEPDAQLTIGGNENEVDVSTYFLNFQGATNGVISVIKKIF